MKSISGAGGGCLATSANDSIQPTCAPWPMMAGAACVMAGAAPRAPAARNILWHHANLSTTAIKTKRKLRKGDKSSSNGKTLELIASATTCMIHV